VSLVGEGNKPLICPQNSFALFLCDSHSRFQELEDIADDSDSEEVQKLDDDQNADS
jgi:hypothetical protein